MPLLHSECSWMWFIVSQMPFPHCFGSSHPYSSGLTQDWPPPGGPPRPPLVKSGLASWAVHPVMSHSLLVIVFMNLSLQAVNLMRAGMLSSSSLGKSISDPPLFRHHHFLVMMVHSSHHSTQDRECYSLSYCLRRISNNTIPGYSVSVLSWGGGPLQVLHS